jgi:hypothetical protein
MSFFDEVDDKNSLRGESYDKQLPRGQNQSPSPYVQRFVKSSLRPGMTMNDSLAKMKAEFMDGYLDAIENSEGKRKGNNFTLNAMLKGAQSTKNNDPVDIKEENELMK